MARRGYLLDTHTLLWWWLGDRALSTSARALLQDKSGRIYVSAVAGIEIATKVCKGNLPTMVEALDRFDELVENDGFVHLPVDRRHAIRAGLLEGDHRDPFDRLLAAQALAEDLVVITRDAEIAGFGCEVLW